MPLADHELMRINQKVERRELFFQSGAPLSFPLRKAWVSTNRVYLYAEIEGILFLKKATAIVEKNRVENPMIRFTEAQSDRFFSDLGLEKNGDLVSSGSNLPAGPHLNAEVLKGLYTKLPRHGHCLVTAASAEVDELHNLVFGTNYQSHIHLDHNLERLQAVKGKLELNTRYVLCDSGVMPFGNESVDGYFSFNAVEEADKEAQKEAYHALKAALKKEAPCICIVNEQEKNHFEAFYKSDTLSAKLKPWKKSGLPYFYFQKTRYAGREASASVSDKRSFGSQLSQA